MKILIVRTFPDVMRIDSYNTQEIGLAKALILSGNVCDIVLYNGKNHDEVKEYSFEKDGQDYRYKIYWCHGYNIVKNGYMPKVRKIMDDYDVIQVDEYDLLQSWYLYTKQIKPTVIYHGLYHSGYTKGYNLKCFFFDRLFLRLKKKSGIYEHIVCLTKSDLASDFIREKGFKRVHTVGVGLDAGRFERSGISRRSTAHKDDNATLLYVGKIEDRRNSLFLLDVFEELLKRGSKVSLKVIGTGEKQYVESFLNKATPFLDQGLMSYQEKITQDELPEEYSSADLFIFPSNYEIFGMVLLEAMYFELPVVSSYNGGSGVLIHGSGDEQNGVIVEDFDKKQWADAISRILNDKGLMNRISENAGQTIREHFLWDSLAPQFVEAYKEAIIQFKNLNDRV